MSGADLGHVDLRRPEGMDQRIYDNLTKEYKRVCQRLHMAEGRATTSARTLTRNKQLKETERETLKRHLDSFRNNPAIRTLLQQIGGDTTEALKILRSIESKQTQMEAQLNSLVQGGSSSSSSSSSSGSVHARVVAEMEAAAAAADARAAAVREAVDVEMVEDDDVEKIKCNLCLDSYRDCMKMPCCEFWACKPCLLSLLHCKDEDVNCPQCRRVFTRFQNFAEMGEAVLPLLPQDVVQVIRHGGCVVPLFNLRGSMFYPEGARWYQRFHTKIGIKESEIDVNPAWVNLKLAPGVVKKVPFSMLSLPDDEIHKFVRAKCNNVWPKRGVQVRILTAFPAMYTFKYFDKPVNDKACCVLEVNDIEDLRLPLSEIRTFETDRSREEEVSFEVGRRWQPNTKMLLKHYLHPWRLYTLQSCSFDETYGPVLNLKENYAARADVAFPLATVENIVIDNFEERRNQFDPFVVHNRPANSGLTLPTPCVVQVTWKNPHGYAEMHLRDDVTFHGYSSPIEIHLTKGSQHGKVSVLDVQSVRYICAGTV